MTPLDVLQLFSVALAREEKWSKTFPCFASKQLQLNWIKLAIQKNPNVLEKWTSYPFTYEQWMCVYNDDEDCAKQLDALGFKRPPLPSPFVSENTINFSTYSVKKQNQQKQIEQKSSQQQEQEQQQKQQQEQEQEQEQQQEQRHEQEQEQQQRQEQQQEQEQTNRTSLFSSSSLSSSSSTDVLHILPSSEIPVTTPNPFIDPPKTSSSSASLRPNPFASTTPTYSSTKPETKSKQKKASLFSKIDTFGKITSDDLDRLYAQKSVVYDSDIEDDLTPMFDA